MILNRDAAIEQIRDIELICRVCQSKDLFFDGIEAINPDDHRDHVSCNVCGAVSYIGWELTCCCMVPAEPEEDRAARLFRPSAGERG